MGGTTSRVGGRKLALFAALIIGVSLLPRIYLLSDPGTYHLHPIRQYQSLMTARDFFERDMNILDPRLEAGLNESLPPSPVALELQVMPWMAAVGYRAAGEPVPWFGNLIGLAFYVGAAVMFTLLARRFLRPEFVLVGLVLFAFSPESFKYSRTFMPDFEVLFFGLSALYFGDRYLRDRRVIDWILVTVALALTLLTKVNYAYVLGIVGLLALIRLGPAALRRIGLWGAVLVATAPSALYYPHAARLSAGAHNYVGSMIQGRILPYLASNLFSADFYAVVGRGSASMLTVPGLALAAVGLAWALTRKPASGEDPARRGYLLAWVAGVSVYLIVMGRDLLAPHNYYFLPVLPIGSILAAGAIQWAADALPALRERARPIAYSAVAVALVGAAGTAYLLRGYYASVREEVALYHDVAADLAENADPESLIVYATQDTGWTYMMLYHSHRFGWHLWQPQSRGQVHASIDRWRDLGARYVLVLDPPGYQYLPAGQFDTGFVSELAESWSTVSLRHGALLVDLAVRR